MNLINKLNELNESGKLPYEIYSELHDLASKCIEIPDHVTNREVFELVFPNEYGAEKSEYEWEDWFDSFYREIDE